MADMSIIPSHSTGLQHYIPLAVLHNNDYNWTPLPPLRENTLTEY